MTHRITQLHWRLNEGKDSAIYEIGVTEYVYLEYSKIDIDMRLVMGIPLDSLSKN